MKNPTKTFYFSYVALGGQVVNTRIQSDSRHVLDDIYGVYGHDIRSIIKIKPSHQLTEEINEVTPLSFITGVFVGAIITVIFYLAIGYFDKL